ncbi:GNAT family N-acetyltransferase [Nocardioides insulae]|uniref:GNAT family N-acetyltransferase n=1 Tax=Nocardioides insulae TaxID=394734 RepID=UPI00040A4290|nr:GNAT family N-acetyltransferase [Nocardioides insulae]
MPTVPRLADQSPDDGPPVILREHRPEDLPGLIEQCRDPEFQRWTGVPVPYDRDEAEAHLGYLRDAWERGQEWSFAVEYDGRYAGTVSLKHHGGVRGEIAYGAHPWVRGRGVTTRALDLLLNWGYAALGLESVQWWAEVGNWPSRRVAWRLGFTIEGTLRQVLPHRGELRDAWVGTLLRTDPREPRSAWLSPPVLEGGGVRLRALSEHDLPRVVEACSEEETQRWLGDLPAPYRLQEATDYLADARLGHARGKHLHWAVTDPETDRLLGSLGLSGIDGSAPELGYWTHPDARCRGLTVAACRLALAHTFAAFSPPVVRARSAEQNAASRRVLEKVGFRTAGVLRRDVPIRTGLVDGVLYDLLPGELTPPS